MVRKTVVKLSVRNQVVIPKTIREKLRLREGDTLLFEEKGGEVRLKRVRSFLDLEGTLPPLKLTTEEIRARALEKMAKEVDIAESEGKLIIKPVEEPGLTLIQLLGGITKENIHHEVAFDEFAEDYRASIKKEETIGHKIKLARLKEKISQKALAWAIGMKQPQLSAIETDKHVPSVKTLKKIADALGVNVETLV